MERRYSRFQCSMVKEFGERVVGLGLVRGIVGMDRMLEVICYVPVVRYIA